MEPWMKKHVRAAAVVVACAAALVAAPSASPAGLTPARWKQYVQVRAKLVKNVNTFMATYRSCARSKGFLTIAWAKCADPSLHKDYWPAMFAMDRFIYHALVSTSPNGDTRECWKAMAFYGSRNQRARNSATHVVQNTWLFKQPMSERRKWAKRFVIDRNVATNARLKVNRVCVPH
jgi:hypothetical protein